jgi:hypothetical protein
MKLFKLLFFATVFMTSCEEAQTTGKPADTKAIETKKMEGTPAPTTALPVENAAAPKADAPKAAADAPKAAEAPKTAATMYECSMKCEKPTAKAGKCGKCGMEMKAIAQK